MFDGPQLRVLVATPRSGSTLFMRIMGGISSVAVTSRNVLMGNMPPGKEKEAGDPFRPDYRIFTDRAHPVFSQARELNRSHVVSKEEFGNWREVGTSDCNSCDFIMFPDDDIIRAVKPIFTVRSPYRVFDSWLAKGWTDFESFRRSFAATFRTYEEARKVAPETLLYTYEAITEHGLHEVVFQSICAYWGLAYNKDIFSFTQEFAANFVYHSEDERKIYQSNPKGLFDTLLASESIVRRTKAHGFLTEEHCRRIADFGLDEVYAQAHEACMVRFKLYSQQ